MEKVTKQQLQHFARQIMFELTPEELDLLYNDFDEFLEQISLLDTIDTTNVKPMHYPFEQPTMYMREDVVDKVISKEDALKNAKVKDENYFLVPKVVK